MSGNCGWSLVSSENLFGITQTCRGTRCCRREPYESPPARATLEGPFHFIARASCSGGPCPFPASRRFGKSQRGQRRRAPSARSCLAALGAGESRGRGSCLAAPAPALMGLPSLIASKAAAAAPPPPPLALALMGLPSRSPQSSLCCHAAKRPRLGPPTSPPTISPITVLRP